MKIFKLIGNAITKANDKIALAASLLIYPLVFVVVLEVFFRYVLSKPSPYTFDLTWMLYGALVFLGGAYCITHNVHVKADIFYNIFPPIVKKISDIVCYVCLFFTAAVAYVYSTGLMMKNAWVYHEISRSTSWGPITGPIKTILFISLVMLSLQGLVKFLQLFSRSKGGDAS